MFNSSVAHSRTKIPDNAVKLAVFVASNRVPYPHGQRLRLRLCSCCDLAHVGNGVAKDLAHIPLAVVDTIIDRGGQFKKLPKQFECLGRSGRRYLANDHVGLRAQIFDQRLAPTPSHISL